MIPEGGAANYLVTGFWGARTHKESKKFGNITLVHDLIPSTESFINNKYFEVFERMKYYFFGAIIN